MYEVTRSMWRVDMIWIVAGLLFLGLGAWLYCCVEPGEGRHLDFGIFVCGMLGVVSLFSTAGTWTLRRKLIVRPDSLTVQWIRRKRITQEDTYTLKVNTRVIVDASYFDTAIYFIDPVSGIFDRFYTGTSGFTRKDAVAAARVLRRAETSRESIREAKSLITKPDVDNIGLSLFRLDGKDYEADYGHDDV